MPEEEVKNEGGTSTSTAEIIVAAAVSAPPRIRLSDSQKESLTKDEWAQRWLTMETYTEHLEERITSMEVELSTSKTSEERLRLQIVECNQREKILIRRIATKDQEVQDCMNQISELKAAQAPGVSLLRSALLDPAVNLLLHRLRQELTLMKTKLEETQNELSAWKFTPDSNTGKRLMAKCRQLYQENEELGRVVSSGRLAKLEGDLALQKTFSEEVKKSQSEVDECLQDIDEDVEGMQSTILFLQQELIKAKEAISDLTQEKISLKSNTSGQTTPTNKQTEDEYKLTNGTHTQTHVSDARTKKNITIDESSHDSYLNTNHKRTLGLCDDSVDLPLNKKNRTGSELSLDYNEEELTLTNGDK